MVRRHLRSALLGASVLGLAATAAPASAQQIDRIVAFGDSYADDGNQFELIGIPNPSVYSTGRFSGGTNYIDTLAQILGVPVDNFAIGGALTGNTNTVTGNSLGFTTEVQSFLAPGGPAAFPDIAGTFDEHDLVTVSIGGNDSRRYQQTGGTLAGATAAAGVSVANATANLDLLVGAGARNISFLAGNTAILPEVAAEPNPALAVQVRQAYANAFSAGIQQTLSGYAADGVIVHYLDLTLVGQRITADPAAYGLTSAGPCPAAQATQCVTDAAFRNQYLFYVDALHLTPAGVAIVQYIAAQLDAPLSLQAPSDLGLDTARQFGRTLSTRVDLNGPRAAQSAGMRLFVVGDTFQRDVGTSDQNNAFDIDGTGVTVGAEFGVPGGVGGVAVNYTRPRARFGDDSARVKGRSVQLGAYAGFGVAGLFAQGHLGYGQDKHRITRTGVIDNLGARPDGHHVTAGAKVGYLMPMTGFRIGPVAALDYASAKVDGYTEAGDPALTMSVSEQSLKSLTGQLGLEMRTGVNVGAASFRPFVAATIEHDFTGDDRAIKFAQTASPTIVNTWNVDRKQETYGRFAGGASANILGSASINAAVSATVGRDSGDEIGAQLGLRLGF